jgi:hypothetical protein
VKDFDDRVFGLNNKSSAGNVGLSGGFGYFIGSNLTAAYRRGKP